MPANASIRVVAKVGNSSGTTVKSKSTSGGIDWFLNWDASTTPDIDSVYHETLALVAGALTIDLTALVRSDEANLSLSGKAVYGYAIHNKGANQMTFTKAGANGYDLFTATGGTIIRAGAVAANTAPAAAGFGTIGGSAKDITVAGTGTQTFDIVLWAGTP